MKQPRTLAVIGIILAAAASRLIAHLPNMTPITALALFGGARLSDKRLAFLIPLLSLILGDLFIGQVGVSHVVFVYGSFVAITAIGLSLQGTSGPLKIANAMIFSSLLFFIVTNFGVWLSAGLYPHTLGGLYACYAMAIPFFRNTLVGDAVFVALMFGSLAMAESLVPQVRQEVSA